MKGATGEIDNSSKSQIHADSDSRNDSGDDSVKDSRISARPSEDAIIERRVDGPNSASLVTSLDVELPSASAG